MTGLNQERVLDVHHWSDSLFSFKTTRDAGLRFRSGHFVMIGLEVEGQPLLRAFSFASANYDDYLEFYSIKVPDGPLTSRLRHIQPGDPILRPRGSSQLDWEVELGVVIGRTARYVSRDAALDYVWGYTIVNDVSARDFQFITSQWMAGKIFETAAPVGPYISDRQEIADPHSLGLRTIVNGKQMQNGNTKTFIFDVRYLVSYLSGLMTLSPGDLIATGTPPGVGFAMKPNPVFLQPGDVVRVEIDALGSVENTVKEA